MIVKTFELCINEQGQEDKNSIPRKFMIGFDVKEPVNNCKGHPDNRLPNEEGFAQISFIRVSNGSHTEKPNHLSDDLWEDFDESIFPEHLASKLENKVFEDRIESLNNFLLRQKNKDSTG
jgi:hypothetical protein